MKLRWYQEDCVEAAIRNIKEVRSQLLCLPTGAGKSIIIAEIIRRMYTADPMLRFMVAAHRKELVEQNAKKLVGLMDFAPVGIYSAGLKSKDSISPIVYGGIQSIAPALKKNPNAFGKRHVLIVDEAHMISKNAEANYASTIATLSELVPDLRIIGLTATPYRLKDGSIVDDGLFDDITYDLCSKKNFLRLIDEGYLSNLVVPTDTTKIDKSSLVESVSDYTEASMTSAFEAINASIIADIKGYLAKDRNKCIVFSSGIKHVELLGEMAGRAGLRYGIIHSKQAAALNDEIIRQFAASDINVLINADKLTTGFDVPDIDLLVCARPTKSTALWVQMLGRGTRIAPGKKDCLVLDYAGNTEELGTINDPIIKGKSKKKDDDTPSVPPLKVCQCGIYLPAQARTCHACGHKFTFADSVAIDRIASVMDVVSRPHIDILSVDACVVKPFVSKAGRDMYRAEYRCGMRFVHEYLFSSAEAEERKQRVPREIIVDFSGKYPNILERRY